VDDLARQLGTSECVVEPAQRVRYMSSLLGKPGKDRSTSCIANRRSQVLRFSHAARQLARVPFQISPPVFRLRPKAVWIMTVGRAIPKGAV
jgi:hypothetical protein